MDIDNKKSGNVYNTNFSLVNEQKLNQFFELNKQITNFVSSEYEGNFEKFVVQNDIEKLFSDAKSMEDLISKTSISFNKKISNTNTVSNETTKYDKEFLIQLIKQSFSNQDSNIVVDNLIFTTIEKCNQDIKEAPLEYIFKKKIFDHLHKLYTNKNAWDLINEDLNNSQNPKKNNNKNKNYRKKKYEKEKSKVKEMQIDSYIKENRNLSEPHKNKSNEIIEECKLNSIQLDTSIMTNFEQKYISEDNLK
jgi:hypothetical protein